VPADVVVDVVVVDAVCAEAMPVVTKNPARNARPNVFLAIFFMT